MHTKKKEKDMVILIIHLLKILKYEYICIKMEDYESRIRATIFIGFIERVKNKLGNDEAETNEKE